MSHAAGVGPAVPARGRAGDAPAAREHARARPQRLPAPARRPVARVPRRGDPSGRAGAGQRGRVGRPRAARPPRAAADRPRRGRVPRAAGAGAASPSSEAGLEPLELGAKEGIALLNGTQLMSAIGALLLADADRLGADRQRHRGDVGRGAAGHGRRVRRRLPARPAASGPDRRRRRAAPPPPRLGPPGEPPRRRPQGPGPVLAALRAAGPRRGARRARPPPARPRHRAELGHRQPARLPRAARGVDPDAMATGGGLVISGGNFHGEPIALALDFAKLAIAELGSISRAADSALLRRRPAQRRPAGVPRRRRRHRTAA